MSSCRSSNRVAASADAPRSRAVSEYPAVVAAAMLAWSVGMSVVLLLFELCFERRYAVLKRRTRPRSDENCIRRDDCFVRVDENGAVSRVDHLNGHASSCVVVE